MARKNPLDALDWANRLPEERRINIGNDAFNEWQRSQPEAARDWFNKLPPNDLRRAPFFQNVVSTMANDPRGADQFAALNAADRAAAKKIIAAMIIPEERRTALFNALKSLSK
jgi:erythromycin esterase-like protein